MEPIQRGVNINSIAISRLATQAFFSSYQCLLDEYMIVLNLKLYTVTER